MAQAAEVGSVPHLIDITEVTSAARDLHRKAGQSKPYYSMRGLIEGAMPHVVVTGDDLPHGLHELVVLDQGKEMIVYSRKINHAAQRVAIAHALGHLVFDKRAGKGCGKTYERASTTAVERRADLFAAELLLPYRDLHPKFTGDLFPTGKARRAWDDY